MSLESYMTEKLEENGLKGWDWCIGSAYGNFPARVVIQAPDRSQRIGRDAENADVALELCIESAKNGEVN